MGLKKCKTLVRYLLVNLCPLKPATEISIDDLLSAVGVAGAPTPPQLHSFRFFPPYPLCLISISSISTFNFKL